MTGRHADLADFLNGERRQVWAVHRETAEPFFLPKGEAESQREFTKTWLRCPYPGCEVAISTRGGSKRDHFFHVNSPPHETGRESEFHLAGKAMLAQWARPRVPDGAAVQEEQTVKDPATRLLRRADVMVTGQSGRRVAYEVEYKAFAIEEWQRKQADYDAEGVACVWLLGHTRVRMATGPDYIRGMGETAVRLPALAAVIAQGGYPLLVVNPTTRQVGTLASDPDFIRPYTGDETLAWMAVESLEVCEFEPRRGLVTPTMRRLDAHEAERRRRAAEEAERARKAEEAARARQEVQQARWRALMATWEASKVYRIFMDRWGAVPPEIAADTPASQFIFAAPAHWHGVLYEELLHGRPSGHDFKWRDVFVALDRHRIKRAAEPHLVYGALDAYFKHLQQVGLVRVHRGLQQQILVFSCTGVTLEQARAAAHVEQEAARRRQEETRQARERLDHLEDQRRAAHVRSLEDRALTKLVIAEDGTRRWVRK